MPLICTYFLNSLCSMVILQGSFACVCSEEFVFIFYRIGIIYIFLVFFQFQLVYSF